MTVVSARLEAELSPRSRAEQADYLASLGMEPAASGQQLRSDVLLVMDLNGQAVGVNESRYGMRASTQAALRESYPWAFFVQPTRCQGHLQTPRIDALPETAHGPSTRVACARRVRRDA